MDLLDCTVMLYPWGSRTAIAELTGRAPSSRPEAELWMGAHPVASSKIHRGGAEVSLEAVVARDPNAELGAASVAAFGPRLSFLLKVLAAAEPLSLQAHPTMAQATRGFADENARGIPLSASFRNYKDASHKPELLCALTPIEALSGFRDPAEVLALFAALDVPATMSPLAPLRMSPDAQGIAETFATLMTMPEERRAPVVAAVVEACKHGTGWATERRLVARLAGLYPGDMGIVSALLLDFVVVAPGEAIFLDAGNMHAYLDGTGVELMASSDNVLRGGLTKKHVDVPELLRVLSFTPQKPRIVRPRVLDAQESVYDTPAREFRLSRLTVDGMFRREVHGPEILLVTEGSVRAGDHTLERGASAFVAANSGEYSLEGTATVFRATTNV